MRLLALCEDPPDATSPTANGSTMITAGVLAALPVDTVLDLAYWSDGSRQLSPAVRARASSVLELPMRSHRGSVLALPVTRLPRATWRRARPDPRIVELARQADAVYVHGLHAFAAAAAALEQCPRPALAHEVDPWSLHWQRRADTRRGLRRAYDLNQAARASRLERRLSGRVAVYAVVAPADALELGRLLGRPVEALANGVDVSRGPGAAASVAGATIGFLGSLDYPPNIAAVRELVTLVLPRVRERVPRARLVLGGRRATSEVLALAGPDVEIQADVPDTGTFFRSVTVMAYPGDEGTGTKNTVLEAVAAGAAVVASPHAARSIPPAGQLRAVDGAGPMAAEIADLLLDPGARRDLQRTATAWGLGLPTWEAVSAGYVRLLRQVTAAGGS